MTTQYIAGPIPASASRSSDAPLLLARLGTGVLRYGLVLLLLLWGGMKFTAFEAEAIRPLVEESPLLAWLLRNIGLRPTSALFGVVELGAALAIAARRFLPRLSAYGSLVASLLFVTTLTFLVSTPGVLAPDNPWGGFLMKDLILLGAALATAGEALAAARAPARATP